MRILILGGTAEARDLAARLGETGLDEVTVSLAGRTSDPVAYPVPVRTGGFGGADGLSAYLAGEGIDLLVDATHPFAAAISDNAAKAVAMSGVTGLRLARPAWTPAAGDNWQIVDTLDEAAAALGPAPRRVFLSVGRQSVAPFLAAPQHHYLIRSVEPVEGLDRFARAEAILARGPFDVAGETDLLAGHAIDVVVTKNSGGTASAAKLEAARRLGLPVILVGRPRPGGLPECPDVAAILAAIDRLRRSPSRGERGPGASR